MDITTTHCCVSFIIGQSCLVSGAELSLGPSCLAFLSDISAGAKLSQHKDWTVLTWTKTTSPQSRQHPPIFKMCVMLLYVVCINKEALINCIVFTTNGNYLVFSMKSLNQMVKYYYFLKLKSVRNLPHVVAMHLTCI